MKQRNLILILVIASVVITAVSLMFGVFFVFFFLPLILPIAFRRKFLHRKPEYRKPPPSEEDPWRYYKDKEWKEKWK